MKLLIKIIKFFFLLVVVLVLIGIGFTTIYGERIEQIILSNIREKSLSEIVVKDVNFSVFENFPYASVKLTDVLILEKEPSQKDTLLYVNQGYLQFNIFNLISKNREISKIVLLDSKLNIKYDMQGNPNFKIFKQAKDKEKKVKLNQIYFSKSAISYLHQAKSVDIKGNTHKVLLQFDAGKQSDFLVKGDLFMQNLLVGKTDYIYEKETKVDANFSISDGVFYIQKSDIFIEDVNFYLDGSIENKDVNLNVVGENQQVKSVLLHMPEKFKSICNGFSLDGNLSCNGTIKGTISKTSNPHFYMDFNLTNGDFKLKENPFHLSALQLIGNIDNGSSNNFENTLIKAKKCSAKTGNGTFSGAFQVQNLNNYYLSADINSNLDLAEVNHLFKSTPFFNMKGTLVGNTKYNGLLSFSEKMKDYFLDGEHQSDLQLKDVEFQYKKFPLLFGFSNLLGQIDDDKINVESSNITIADSDFKFEGSITQFTPYLLNASTKIEVKGEIESVYVKFDELMTIKDINASDRKLVSVSTMPNWIEADLNTKIEQLSYKYFVAENIDAEIDYRNLTLKAKEVKMNTLNGEVTGEVKFYEHPNNYLKLFTSAHLEKINIRDLFTGFQNFGQEFIQDKHIKGIGTADIQLQSSWNPGFEFDPNKLQLNSHLIIEKGELLEFSPLLNLSSYVSVEELQNVKFSTLENTIKIRNNNINFEAMEIKSSALSVFISGTHSFDNEIDYQIRLLLSELISKKARSKNKKLDNEFGLVGDDGLGRTNLYLRMDGNV
ncbi:MAG: AsmA-like C-terminal region-containing protein, partial [Bacteroidota bacterium]|nr:AsmA-like C-terminal region-containing protein [Bacteroidota bacterium]